MKGAKQSETQKRKKKKENKRSDYHGKNITRRKRIIMRNHRKY